MLSLHHVAPDMRSIMSRTAPSGGRQPQAAGCAQIKVTCAKVTSLPRRGAVLLQNKENKTALQMTAPKRTSTNFDILDGTFS